MPWGPCFRERAARRTVVGLGEPLSRGLPSRRPGEGDVVPAGNRDLQGTACDHLPAHCREVGRVIELRGRSEGLLREVDRGEQCPMALED